MTLRNCLGGLAVLGLAGCSYAIVAGTTVNHAYEGKMRRLLVLNNLGTGWNSQLTATFDVAFAGAMARCGVTVHVIDGDSLQLNSPDRTRAELHAFQPDTALVAVWTQRQTSNNASSQDSLFTLAQMHQPHETAYAGEVWKATIKSSLGGMNLGPTNGAVLAQKVADQLAQDRMVQNCQPAPAPAG